MIYHGNSLNSIKKKPIKLKIPNKYILFVGRRTGYKNFIFFLESISDLLYKRQDLYLICAGGGGIQQHERKFFEKMKISEKIIQCDFDDNALAYLYEKACLLAFPSLHEGFGIPILEAFGCNCPVVCSNTSSLPEIAKDGAKYFDPRNKQSITNALTSVLDNKDLQKDLISRGKKIEKTYSWRKTAEETYRLYRSIICL